jgi:fatty acid kinase fatty acid binding subunit
MRGSTTGRYPAVAGQRPARVRMVTDSSADLLPTHARAIGVVVVPNWILLDGQALRDGVELTAAQFYARLPHTRTVPSTQPAAVDDCAATYHWLFRQGVTAILAVHLSARLSRVLQHATAARDALGPAPIDGIDSRLSGIARWPAITRAATRAGLGAPPQEIHAQVLAILARTRLYVLVESLDPLRRAGRIGRAGVLLGTLLDAHPIRTIEQGELTPVATARPRERALRRMREPVRGLGPLETLLICGTSSEAIAEWEAVLAEGYEGVIQKTWLGPTQGANTGPAVAVAAVVRS